MPGTQSIEGLASNLDISSIVDSILSYEEIPVTYLENDKAYKTQQAAAYNAVLAKFIALQTQVDLLRKETSFDKAEINISDETILSATANDRVSSGSYSLRVLSLAQNHQLASQGVDDATGNIFGTGTIKLSIGQSSLTTINIESGNNNLVAIKDAINSANVGVTASIINDGSSSKPYRLLLTADKTGAINKINLETSLSGGTALDFVNNAFDSPESLATSAATTSQISLGTTASFGGRENKIYRFTVEGNGTQTVGSDIITINWTDGTHSGSVLVTQGDTEVELTGEGSDGLKLSFSQGDLTAGDTFQVATFAPLLQEAADAQVAIGGGGGNGGSPIVINSQTNEFKDVIAGVTLNVKKTTDPGSIVTLSTDIDTEAIKTMVDDFVTKYNDVMDFIDNQFKYNADTKESGVLFAEYSLQVMQSTLRTSSTLAINELRGEINSLASIGIRSGANGKLSTVNSAKLLDSIGNDFDNLVKLFTDSAVSSSPFIEFIAASDKTIPGSNYDVEITQAATRGFFQGMAINDPALSPITLDGTNNVLKLQVDGVLSGNLVLSERTYNSGADLAREIQTRIDSDGKVGGKDVTVEWVDLASSGYLKITSGSFGSKSRIQIDAAVPNSAFSILGLAAGTINPGRDVEGTINGEKATGKGQVLTGNEGNRTTDGLKLKIMFTANQLIAGGPEGTLSFTQGLATKMDKALESITKSIDGSIARRTSSLNKQIESITKQIEDYNKRLEKRREDLYEEFQAMEDALAQYQSVGSYLTSQLENVSNNWSQILGNKE